MDNKIRVNQNLSRYADLIGKTENSEGIIPYSNNPEIIKNLLYFFSELEQTKKDIFGYIEFDIEDFSSQFGYEPNNYQKKIKSSLSIKVSGSDEKKIVSNGFENFLLEIASNNLPVKIKNERGNLAIKFIPVVDEIEMSIRNDNTKKRKYFLKLHESFKETFLNFYNLTHSELYKNLKKNNQRSKGLQDLYLKLEYYKSQLIKEHGVKKNLSISCYFEELWRVADISETSTAKDKKRYINDKIKKIQKEAENLKKDLEKRQEINKNIDVYDFNFSISWVKGENSTWAYNPIITFHFTKEYILQIKKEEEKQHYIFERLYKENLTSEYKNTSKKYTLEKWIDNDKIDSQLKRSVYKKLYKKTYNNKDIAETYLIKRFDKI